MSFLRSIATDFVEKRLWPIAALLGAALLAVLAYIALSGGSSPAPAPAAAVPATGTGVSVTAAPANPSVAVSETTTGARFQRQAGAHDPFVPLGSGTSGTAAAGSAKAGATGGSTAGTPVTLAKNAVKVSGGSSAGTPAPATSPPSSVVTPPATKPPAPTTPTKPGINTHPVDVRFGTVPTTSGPDGTTQQGAPVLVNHPNLARLSPLPDAKSPIVVFMGVRSDGTTATFALMHEAILRGDGVCRPSSLKCQLIDLKAGQKEQLDYVTPDLSVVRYELDLVSVAAAPVARPAAVRFFHRESRSGRNLLKSDFPPGVGTLTYSYRTGSLQTAPAAAAAARSRVNPVVATAAQGSPAYAPPLPLAGPPVVQPGWLDALLHAL